VFKQLTNKTFTGYVNGLRIAKAVEMLKSKHIRNETEKGL